MVEGGGGPESGSSKPASSFESAAGRLRFTVELRPGETTIVSWKKLLKEATSTNKTKAAAATSASLKPNNHHQNQQQQPSASQPPPPAASKQSPPNDSQAQAGPNRLSNVIEKIERMYAGNGSSEEEDVFLDDVPDDDEYDTEDSFIDDAELDDYFQVDKSAIKHDGFFVNRGKLERIEPTISMNQQPKKRRRKDATKGHDGNDDEHAPNKHVKLGNKGRKTSSSMEKSSGQPRKVAVPNLHSKDGHLAASLANVAEVSIKKKTADARNTADPSGLLHDDVIGQEKDADLLRTGILASKNQNSKLKQSGDVQDTSTQRSNDKTSNISKTYSEKHPNNAGDLDQIIQRKEKGWHVGRFDLNVPASKDPMQVTKGPPTVRKEGSNVRPKSSMLDKAIRELEKIVAESRPPTTEVQDSDNSSQVKRRLPPEIKQKLAKVARLAQASFGKIPKDVINRLMSIIGHLVQLRTLKRNLKIMANMGLSARQEKDDRLQKMKQEVAEMVTQRIPYMKMKVEHQTSNSDDFQEAVPEEKEALKRKLSLDDALENKICDLYDLYVERLEEDSGPPVRRLYEELATFWPSGVMDTDGIKRVIYRAKDRRKALFNRRTDQEKIKRKKVLAPKAEKTVQGDAINLNQTLQHIHEKLQSDHASSMASKPVSSCTVSQAAAAFAGTLHNVDKPKQERVKGSSSSNPVDAMTIDALLLPKKKVKRKQPITDAGGAQFHLEKASVVETKASEERHKHHKKQHVTNIQLAPGNPPF